MRRLFAGRENPVVGDSALSDSNSLFIDIGTRRPLPACAAICPRYPSPAFFTASNFRFPAAYLRSS
jgi:hypothetical protein